MDQTAGQSRRIPEKRRGHPDGLLTERASDDPRARLRSEPHDGDDGRQRDRLGRIERCQPRGADRPALHRKHRERGGLQGADSLDVRQCHRWCGKLQYAQCVRSTRSPRLRADRREHGLERFQLEQNPRPRPRRKSRAPHLSRGPPPIFECISGQPPGYRRLRRLRSHQPARLQCVARAQRDRTAGLHPARCAHALHRG